MAIRDRWNRMRSAAATSTTYTSPSSSPVSSPVSAPTSPGVWGTITGFNWSSSRTATGGSSSNASTEAGGTNSDEHQQQQQQRQQSQQQRQYKQQSPRAKITFTLPARPKAPKSSSSSSSSRRSRPHPSERPLTEENLAYQQVFANYTLTFGSSRCSLDGDVSPCSSRRGSLDMPPV